MTGLRFFLQSLVSASALALMSATAQPLPVVFGLLCHGHIHTCACLRRARFFGRCLPNRMKYRSSNSLADLASVSAVNRSPSGNCMPVAQGCGCVAVGASMARVVFVRKTPPDSDLSPTL